MICIIHFQNQKMYWYKENLDHIVNQIYKGEGNSELIRDFLVAYEAESGNKSLRNVNNGELFLNVILFNFGSRVFSRIGSLSGRKNKTLYKKVHNSASSGFKYYRNNCSSAKSGSILFSYSISYSAVGL